MKTVRTWATIAILSLGMGTALAQGGGPGPQAGPGAGTGMGPGMGPGMGAGMGPGAGRGPGARWGTDFTPGWSLMTPQERAEHQNRMREMKTYQECEAFMRQHREQMAERAKAQGKSLPPMNRDACEGLKP